MDQIEERLRILEQELKDLRRRIDELERRKPIRLAKAKVARL